LGSLIAELHDKGVYFRSLHLGNVVQNEAGQIGLIDISDMTCGDTSLGRLKRARNFQHLFRYRQDVSSLAPHRAAFIKGYTQKLPEKNAVHFRKRLDALFNEQATERG